MVAEPCHTGGRAADGVVVDPPETTVPDEPLIMELVDGVEDSVPAVIEEELPVAKFEMATLAEPL